MRDDRLLLPDGEFGNMHDMYILENNIRIQLRVEPEEVIILPDDAWWPRRDSFSALTGSQKAEQSSYRSRFPHGSCRTAAPVETWRS